MKQFRTLAAALAASTMLCAPLMVQMPAQTTASTTSSTTAKSRKHTAKRKVHKETESERQLREMREQMAAQQTQIDALKDQLNGKDQQVTTAQSQAAAAQSQAATASDAATQAAAAAAQANTAAAANTSKIDEVSGTVTDLKASTAKVADTQAKIKDEVESPAAVHYKGVTITPVGFFALEGVYRQHSVNSDINTPFNSIPFPSASEGHVSELNFTGRQSRIGALFQGDAGAYKLSGYYEADFLGTGTSSNNNQSNSYVLRQRQIWGQAALASGFTVTGGQMWSLVTEDGHGTDNRTEKLPNTIDPSYMVGYSWIRQPGLRLQQHFGGATTGFTMALGVEQAQITSFTVNGSAAPTSYFFGGGGTNGGLYNAAAGNTGTNLATYANNLAPDIIVKGAIDFPHAHIEGGGLARFLRDYYNPITSVTSANVYTYATNQVSNTSAAGGGFGSIRVSPAKFVDVAFQAMGGTGVGRYGASQLADATLRPDQALEPIRNYHGLFSLETHPAKKLDVYAYYGGEYAQRTVYATQTGALIGYGPRNTNVSGCYALPAANSTTLGAGVGGSDTAANCGAPTRYIQEGMFGFTYRVVNNPRYGRLQYQTTYSYLQRSSWSGNNVPTTGSVIGPAGPRAQNNMIDLSMRYYIP